MEEKSEPAASAAASPTISKPSPNPHREIKAVARKFADNPHQNPDPGVWGVLTAISKNARQRPQGMNILLNGEEHCIGRMVEDTRFQIGSIAVSANHCKIYRKLVACSDDELAPDSCAPVFLKDTSTNGTFVNWKKLRKRSPEVRLQHGDIISFVAPPHEERSYAFVYREVGKSMSGANAANLKRKSGVELITEDFCNESKRTKGIGIGAAEGPVSLADVRSLQRSNMELNELKEHISNSYTDQIMELRSMLGFKQKDIDEVNTSSAEFRSTIKDLNERLSALMQSRIDVVEVIHSQKTSISELETQLDEERTQRREEREKAASDLKAALQRVHAETEEEIKHQAVIHLRQNREQEEEISKLQDSEKESRILLDTLRSRLVDARENLVMSEEKVRQLEAQVQEEHVASEISRKRAENGDFEFNRLKKEFEVEKQVACEEAWAKVSALEREIAAAIHELSIEKERFQDARERIILRETQLQAFCSTTEEISALFVKQQEQLKTMWKTLDDENYENISAGFDLNPCPKENKNEGLNTQGDQMSHVNIADSRTPGLSTTKDARFVTVSSSDDTSATEKHDCDARRQEEENGERDLECTTTSKSTKGFGSDIYGVGMTPIHDGEALETEQVPETESPAADIGMDEHASLLHKCNTLAGDTVQLDDEVHVQDNMKSEGPGDGNNHCYQTRFEDMEVDTLRTTDHLTSEVPGSWANSTTPSYGENNSPGNGENDSPRNGNTPHDQSGAAGTLASFANGQAEERQTNVAISAIARLSEEHCALDALLEIVAHEFKDQFRGRHSGEKNESMSDAQTEDGSNENEGVSEK